MISGTESDVARTNDDPTGSSSVVGPSPDYLHLTGCPHVRPPNLYLSCTPAAREARGIRRMVGESCQLGLLSSVGIGREGRGALKARSALINGAVSADKNQLQSDSIIPRATSLAARRKSRRAVIVGPLQITAAISSRARFSSDKSSAPRRHLALRGRRTASCASVAQLTNQPGACVHSPRLPLLRRGPRPP